MTGQTNRTDIVTFLEKAKRLISKGKYDFVPRRKNMQALAAHGLTITDAKAEILALVANDYYKGPKQDFDPERTGDIWEFKKEVDGMQFYVKVKITQENGEDILKCLSFHEAGFA
ncbi:MAG: type II toxin-antitoxin system MqsR family toxin [Lachnospiraceae bacterium]|nr:type II toxin-antitoxin system MqsR family toxin [Lachnospiraceae bacterium]MCM1410032.1 type II toxin-antitoxin system MqsR family toxin [Lachnospiraceae bacterium]